MGFKCGIVGLPNVGKSTLFNALTAANIEAANYPFCTIEANIGIVPINDKRLTQLAQIVKPKKVVMTTMEFVDIAGLVQGASKGEGLGNQFLREIAQTDAIVHVVRCFEDDDIAHVAGKVSPLDDIEIINTELCLADLAVVEKYYEKTLKNSKADPKAALEIKNLLEKILPILSAGNSVRSLSFNAQEQKLLTNLQLLTQKPVLYVANVGEDDFADNPHVNAVKTFAESENSKTIPICAHFEAQISELDATEKQDFLRETGQTESALNRLIKAGYALLGLQTYFTAGVKEVRAWTIKKGDNGAQAAGKIHSDFEKGFIRAETISFTDFIQYGGEKNAKEAGKLRAEGKQYIVKDGDIIHFLFNI